MQVVAYLAPLCRADFQNFVNEAHRRGLRVATHAHGDVAVNAAMDAGIDCVEHGFMISDETIQRLVDTGTFLVSTTGLTENWDISDQPRSLQAKAADVFPRSKQSLTNAIEAGVKIALGTDAPALWHGRNAEELAVLVKLAKSRRTRFAIRIIAVLLILLIPLVPALKGLRETMQEQTESYVY